MRTFNRAKRKQSGEWAVVETWARGGFGHGRDRRVRQVVPPRVAVDVAPDHPRLQDFATTFDLDDLPEDDLDLVPFPAPRARC